MKYDLSFNPLIFYLKQRFLHQTFPFFLFELPVKLGRAGPWKRKMMMAWCCSLEDLRKVLPSFTWWLIDKSSDDTWSSIMARAKWWKLMSGILKSRNAQNFFLFHFFSHSFVQALVSEEKWIIWRGEINNEMALFLAMLMLTLTLMLMLWSLSVNK